jgi:hypothetical protein
VINRKSKAKNIESAEIPCEKCGKAAIGSKTCLRCKKVICDSCARFYEDDRYCPACFEKIKALYKLA